MTRKIRTLLGMTLISALVIGGCTLFGRDASESEKASDQGHYQAAYESYVSQRNEAWIHEVDYLVENFVKLHPDPFEFVEEEMFYSRADEIKQSVDALSDFEIQVELARLIASLKDSHSYIPFYQFFGDELLPIKLDEVDGKIYCINATSDYENMIHREVLSMNGIPVDTIIQAYSGIGPAENEQWQTVLSTSIMRLPKALKLFDDKRVDFSPVHVSYLDNDEIKHVDVQGLSYEEHIKNDYVYDDRKHMLVDLMDHNDDSYSYKYLDDHKIMLINYDKCSEEKDQSFEDFNNEVWEQIESKEVEKLIIDLRYNTGGSSGLFDPFRLRLMKDKTFNKSDRTYVITGKRTFSSGTATSAYFKRLTNATLIGEDTGGSPNSFGNTRDYNIFELPYSQLKVYYANNFFGFGPGMGHTVTPDIHFANSIDQYTNDSDMIIDMIASYSIHE